MFNIYNDVLIFGMFNFYLEMVIPTVLFMRHEDKRSAFFARLFLCVIMSVLLYYLPFVRIYAFSFGYLIVLFAVALQMTFCFKVSFFKALFYSIAGFAVQHMAWDIVLMLISIIGVQNFNVLSGYICYIGVYSLVYAICAIVVPTKKCVGELKGRNIATFIFSGIIIIMVWAMSALLSYYRLWNIFTRIYAIICALFALCVQFGFFKNNYLQNENERYAYEKILVEELLNQSKKQQALTKDTIEIIETKCHDLKHQIYALRNLKQEDRSACLDELENAIMVYGNIAKTGNYALDIVLTEKCLYCEKDKIDFTYIVDGEAMNFLDPVDISLLFGNVIDNAIECVKNYDSDKRIIRLNVSVNKSFLCLHSENYCEREVKFENGLPVTSKVGSEHGYGVKSIRYIVEKYGGSLLMQQSGNLFSVNAMLPLKK